MTADAAPIAGLEWSPDCLVTTVCLRERRLGSGYLRTIRKNAAHLRATGGKPDEELVMEGVRGRTLAVSER